MLYIAGTSISVFLAVLLILKKNKHAADPILICWLVANALHQFLFYLDISGISSAYPFWAGLNIPFAYLHGPFLFLYIFRILFTNRPGRYLTFLHFLPFIFGYLYLWNFYSLEPGQKAYNVTHGMADFPVKISWHFRAVLVSGFTYILLSIALLIKHRAQFKNNFSNTTSSNYKWIALNIALMTLIWIVLMVGNIRQVFIVVVLNTIIIGIFGIRNTPYFIDPIDLTKPEPDEENGELQRYRKSGLTSSLKRSLRHDLDELMANEKLFTDCNLSLDKLAAKLKVHPNYLSQFINEELQLSFYDYINQLRVEEFKLQVQQPQNSRFSFLALALECGFNSKASFNRNFKKITGVTPTAFMHNLKEA